MSRKRALAATVAAQAVLAAALVASPAQAGWFGWGKKAEPAAETAAEPAKPNAPAAAQPPRPATAEERAVVQRLDPLARAAFWTREFDLNPRDAAAGVALSAALRAMGRNAEAADVTTRLLAVEPDHVDGLLEHARAQIAQDQGFHAIAPCRKAMALAPRDWRAASLLGVAYQQVEREAEARQAWEQALALSPDNPAVLANLALSHAADGDLTKAETLLRRAAARPDATLQVRQNLALVLGLQGKLAEAEKLVREDLPPAVASANLAWLRSAAAAKGVRSWETLGDTTP